MKHLLIILSFLLLSSPVIGDNHKGETLYRWGNILLIMFGKDLEIKTLTLYIKVNVKNGKPHGQGTVITLSRWKTSMKGEWKDGERTWSRNRVFN